MIFFRDTLQWCFRNMALSDTSGFQTSHVLDLGHTECHRGISRPHKFHKITHFIIDTFAQCVKECTDALWISLRSVVKQRYICIYGKRKGYLCEIGKEAQRRDNKTCVY